MPIEDIHELIDVLEKAGELKRISTQVDSELELAEILRRTMYDVNQAAQDDMVDTGQDEEIIDRFADFKV